MPPAERAVSGLAPCLMIQGTSSAVGKSLLTTAFCRIIARAGYRVAPFKSQNMSLNSAVTVDGGEIGRAQAAQAEAAGIEATVDMNPILLKPEADQRSQVVVRGRPVASVSFREYARMRPELVRVVAESLDRLRRAYDVVLIEGAGSPAEINLRDGEIVNMRIAGLAGAPVLLVGDIERGGVFAAFVGTLALLPREDRARIAGFIVNKFRGDPSLLTPGLDELTARTGVPVLGVVPSITDPLVPAEDSLNLEDLERRAGRGSVEIAVPRFPRMANFDDLEPLAREPEVRLVFARRPEDLDRADLILLPGSKNTAADLEWLRRTGLAAAITTAAAYGRPVVGICGGYQMLGLEVRDPHRVESAAATTPGLGLLQAVTTLEREKTTARVRARVTPGAGVFAGAAGLEIEAYEIHMGRTDVVEPRWPFAVLERQGRRLEEPDGALNAAGNVVGTYLHGLFVNDGLRRALLVEVATRKGQVPDPRWGAPTVTRARYDELADIVAASCNLGAIGKLLALNLGDGAARPPGRRGR
jgi:adenosylcobyric acid synthase